MGARRLPRVARRLLPLVSGALFATAAAGCARVERWLYPPPPTVADGLVLSGGEIRSPEPVPPEVAADMAGAEEYYRREEFSGARRLYARVAEDTNAPPLVAEKARFYQAECYRLEGNYPRAAEAYTRMLQDFPTGVYREQACGHLFQIANYWLDDTREEMEQEREKLEGKRSFVIPAVFHFEKSKPFLDAEGHALKALENVYLHDITGPYADKALWLIGYVHFYRGNYTEADYYLTQLIDLHKDSKLRPMAIELAIMAKNNSTGGPAYDGRKSAEALKLVHAARSSEPELATKRADFLDRQLLAITHQQATKDFETAEFYLRRGRPGSAYFYFEIVRRRYPGSKFAELATARMEELRREAIEKQARGEAGDSSFIDAAQRYWDRLWGDDRPAGEGPEASGEGSTELPAPRRAPEPAAPAPEPAKPIPQEFLPR
ncbi:MAG TPA: tetratricopeptide repeat protein [Gemmataceae bacterium]